MSTGGSGGAGDCRVSGALRATGDRLAPRSAGAPRGRIRTVKAVLLGLDLQRLAQCDLVIDDQVPPVLMFGGDPFLISGADDKSPLTYLQARPYRVDAMVTAEVVR